MPIIRAAGGVLWTDGTDTPLVAVVHRPRYDDWSLPKGKRASGEHLIQTATREVAEETGFAAVVGQRLPSQQYEVLDGDKTVDWWAMRAAGGAFRPGNEVDQLRWLSAAGATPLLTYDRDRLVLGAFGTAPIPSAFVLLVRHAKAGNRAAWSGDDRLRPLDSAGAKQARRLAEILPMWAPERVASADRLRCTQTVAPLAAALELSVELEPAASEEAFQADPDTAIARIRGLAKLGGASVLCSQGGAIPAAVSMLAAADGVELDSPRGLRSASSANSAPHDVPAKKGSVWALAFAGERLLAADYYPDFRS